MFARRERTKMLGSNTPPDETRMVDVVPPWDWPYPTLIGFSVSFPCLIAPDDRITVLINFSGPQPMTVTGKVDVRLKSSHPNSRAGGNGNSMPGIPSRNDSLVLCRVAPT
jgi:hypothetical protein